MGFLSSLAPLVGSVGGAFVGGPVGAAAGGALGGALAGNEKHQEQQRLADAQRRQAAGMARFSPWTGMQPNAISSPGSETEAIGSGALSGGTTGYGIGGDNFFKPAEAAAPAAAQAGDWSGVSAALQPQPSGGTWAGVSRLPNMKSNNLLVSKN